MTDAVDEIQRAWERERPDLGVASIGIITRIWRLARLFEQRRAEMLRRVGTDSSTLDLLSTLRRAGPPYQLTPGQIAERSLLSSGGVSQRLSRAEAAGLITRRTAQGDSRSVIVSMTRDANRLLDDAVTELLRAEQESLAALDDHEQRALADSLRRLLRSLQQG